MRGDILLGGAFAAVVAASPWGPPYPPFYHSQPEWPPASRTVPPGISCASETRWEPHPYHPATVTNGPACPTSTAKPTTTTASGPCASVAVLVKSFSSTASPKATPTIPADLAYDCINTVPFNASAAIALLDAIRPYLVWQTTIAYIKDPPSEYAEKVQAPYDFEADFDRIYQKVKSDGYQNEYDFGFDLYRSFQNTHDGHFVFYPDSVASVFTFGRRIPLVSVSTDGQSVPEIYAYPDVLAAFHGNATFQPSPITAINGQDSIEFLLNFAEFGSLQDKDALWNNIFWEAAQVSLGTSGSGTGTFSGGGRGRFIYPGANTTLTFRNGSTSVTENFARVLPDFTNITSGEDIYQNFLVPTEVPEPVETLAASTSSSSASSSSSSTATTTTPVPGYPTNPVIREKSNLNSGYFLEGDGYDDVAVLSVPSFVGTDTDEIDFQAVNTYLINQAVAHNKSKLIVDVSANGGGTILQGYDLFKQLFPSILPYGATRFTAHEAHDLIGQEVSAFSLLHPRNSTNTTVANILSTNFDYHTDADINYRPFTSWPEKFGPHAYGPGPTNYTSIIRWNLSDILTPLNSGGIDVSGYLNRSNITTQPFRAENIVIVYDGYCASTCTIFSELMRQQGHVATIALGGRPSRDPIQAVGGVKGTNDFGYADVLSNVELPFQLHLLHDPEYYNATALGAYSNLPNLRATTANLNVRDGIRQGDASELPLQFRYEPADCRLFYTAAMVLDQTALWKTVADTAFRRVNHCVAGSLAGNATSSSSSSSGRRGVLDARRPVPHVVRRDWDASAHHAAMANGPFMGQGVGHRTGGPGMGFMAV